MTKEVSKRSSGGPVVPPNYRGVQAAAGQALALRQKISLAHSAPTPDLLAEVDELAGRAGEVLAALSPATVPGAELEIAGHLACLLAAFTNSGSADARMFGVLLTDDVLSLKPSAAAAEIACRRWRQTEKFLPAISEIMDAVRREQESLNAAVEFLRKLPEERARLQRGLERE